MSNEEQAQQIFESAIDMMDSIRAINGEKYARTVEIALNMLKIRDLMGMFLTDLETRLGSDRCDAIWVACNTIFANIISLDSHNAEIVGKVKPSELIDWAQKLKEIEQRGAMKMAGIDE